MNTSNKWATINFNEICLEIGKKVMRVQKASKLCLTDLLFKKNGRNSLAKILKTSCKMLSILHSKNLSRFWAPITIFGSGALFTKSNGLTLSDSCRHL